MRRTVMFMLLAVLPLLLSAVVRAEPDPKLPPIKVVKDAKPKPGIFKAATRKKPLVIRSEEDAAPHFSKDALAKLKTQVDFEQQIVLVFAWKGSGQDRLTYEVLESYPEQVVFTYKPGRTRDLRPHVYVYVLRSNVKWRNKS